MRKIVFFFHADTVGTDQQDLFLFPDNVTTEEIQQHCDEYGNENANSWDRGDYEEDGFDNYEEYFDDYLQQCGWWWEDYNPDKHNGGFVGTPEGYEADKYDD